MRIFFPSDYFMKKTIIFLFTDDFIFMNEFQVTKIGAHKTTNLNQ